MDCVFAVFAFSPFFAFSFFPVSVLGVFAFSAFSCSAGGTPAAGTQISCAQDCRMSVVLHLCIWPLCSNLGSFLKCYPRSDSSAGPGMPLRQRGDECNWCLVYWDKIPASCSQRHKKYLQRLAIAILQFSCQLQKVKLSQLLQLLTFRVLYLEAGARLARSFRVGQNTFSMPGCCLYVVEGWLGSLNSWVTRVCIILRQWNNDTARENKAHPHFSNHFPNFWWLQIWLESFTLWQFLCLPQDSDTATMRNDKHAECSLSMNHAIARA